MARGDFRPQTGDAYPTTPERNVAKYVMDTARLFLANKEPARALDIAVEAWVHERGNKLDSLERREPPHVG